MRAARHEFLEHGVKATPLRAIARRARTNLGMIYYYFPTKEDLFLAVIEEPYAKIVDSVGAVLAGTQPVRERLRNLFRRIAAATPDEAETFRLVVSEGLKSPELRSKVFARVWRGHLPIVFRALEDGKREGLLDPSVPTPLLGIVTAAMAIVPQAAARSVPIGLVANDALADRLIELLLNGIGAPAVPAVAAAAVASPAPTSTKKPKARR